MNTRLPFGIIRLVGSGLLAIATFLSIQPKALAAAPPPDPAHAAHVASGAMPPDPVKGAALSQQIAQLQAKVVQLEASLAASAPLMAGASANAPMPGMPGAVSPATPAMSMGMDKMKTGAPMPGMGATATPAPPMAGMSGPATPAGGMMGMMSQMMGMMDKMMPMTPAAPAAGAPMTGGSMPAMPPSSMGMMAKDKMEMAGMMGMAPMPGAVPDAMPQSALPGFPGSSHLYHIGATGFFLDHPQHIALTTQQQGALNKAREQAALAKSTAERAVEQAEQELWMLTAADQPDAMAIQGKIASIGKLRGDERLAFIRAVGEASKLLTDEQRMSLTGFAPPAPAAMPAGGMKDM